MKINYKEIIILNEEENFFTIYSYLGKFIPTNLGGYV